MRLIQKIITVCLILAMTTAPVVAANDVLSQKPAPASVASPAGGLPPVAVPSDQTNINQILNSTVTSPSTSAPPVLLPNVGGVPLPGLPPELTDHNKNKTIDLGPLHVGPLIQIAKLRPLRMEAEYTQPITLRDALAYVLINSLPIRINLESYANQRYQFWGDVGAFLPTIGLTQVFAHSLVLPSTNVDARVFDPSVSIPVFQGGSILYSMLAQYYRASAAHRQFDASVNDTLLNTYNAYYNLLLQRALLQIAIKSVEVSQEQLRLNEQLYFAGTGTRFAVMQSRTQLAMDRQTLLTQQVSVRLASIELGFTMNMPLSINLMPADMTVTEASIVDESMNIEDFMNAALVHRPELFQYTKLRLAAARNIMNNAATLYPSSTFTITPQVSSVTVTGESAGVGSTDLGALNSAASNIRNTFSTTGATSPAVGVTTAGVPVINGTALQVAQVAAGTGGLTVTPGATNTTFGTATAATTTGGNGSTVVTGGSGILGSTTGVNTGSTSNTGVGNIGAFGGKFNSITLLNNENWSIGGLGLTATGNILQARAQARQAMLQANQVMTNINDQVRPDYLNMMAARAQIDVTATGVASSAEELRLANLRVQMGVGTNLELIQAQRDYITSLINQAQAIIACNQAQATLLHDTGLISLEALTIGYKLPRGPIPAPTF
jgi:outer membrane protein TolC